MMHFSSYAESNDQNARFSRLLRSYLRSKGLNTERMLGLIALVLLDDGFDVLQLGPEPMSDPQLADSVSLIAEHMQAALHRQN